MTIEIIPDKCMLFVYGTLMSTYKNNYILTNSKSIFVGNAQTMEKYTMYVMGHLDGYNNGKGVPFVNKYISSSYIYGELWEITSNTLIEIDKLEGHPGWYIRENISIQFGNNIINAYIYFNNNVDDNSYYKADVKIANSGNFNIQ
jgi:gamma-glutamylaminecyclotransferase